MRKINAFLCFHCKVILNDYFEVSPRYETAPCGTVCPWCQKEHALMKFDLIERLI